MSKEEKYLVALGMLENAYINYTRGSVSHKILRNDIQGYVSYLQQENQKLKQQLEEEKDIRNKAIEKIKMLSGFNRTGEYNSFKMYSADFKELVQILQNKE